MAAPAPVSTGSGSRGGCIIQYPLLWAPDWIQPQTRAADRVRGEEDLRRAALPSLPPSVHINFDLKGSPIWLCSMARRCRGSSPAAKAELLLLQRSHMPAALGTDRLRPPRAAWHGHAADAELMACWKLIVGPHKSLEVHLTCVLQHNKLPCDWIQNAACALLCWNTLPNHLPGAGFSKCCSLQVYCLPDKLVKNSQNLGISFVSH